MEPFTRLWPDPVQAQRNLEQELSFGDRAHLPNAANSCQLMAFTRNVELVMSSVQTITSTDGVRLHVRTSGTPSGRPILFVHGFAQSLWCWTKQFAAPDLQRFHLVAFDLRGHGRSDKPIQASAYQSSTAWADDIAAVIEGLALEKPIVVFWSYSGLVLCDYLRHFSCNSVSGINLVSARTKVGTPTARQMSGTLFIDLVPGFCSTAAADREVAVRRFLENLTEHDIPDPDFYTMLGYNLAVPAHVCEAMLDRSLDNDDVLQDIRCPVLVTHGDKDTSVLPDMAKHHAQVVPHAKLSLWPGVGHAPFYEDSQRFNAELADFAAECFATP
jgi:non-heme chloroperoxidase